MSDFTFDQFTKRLVFAEKKETFNPANMELSPESIADIKGINDFIHNSLDDIIKDGLSSVDLENRVTYNGNTKALYVPIWLTAVMKNVILGKVDMPERLNDQKQVVTNNMINDAHKILDEIRVYDGKILSDFSIDKNSSGEYNIPKGSNVKALTTLIKNIVMSLAQLSGTDSKHADTLSNYAKRITHVPTYATDSDGDSPFTSWLGDLRVRANPRKKVSKINDDGSSTEEVDVKYTNAQRKKDLARDLATIDVPYDNLTKVQKNLQTIATQLRKGLLGSVKVQRMMNKDINRRKIIKAIDRSVNVLDKENDDMSRGIDDMFGNLDQILSSATDLDVDNQAISAFSGKGSMNAINIVHTVLIALYGVNPSSDELTQYATNLLQASGRLRESMSKNDITTFNDFDDILQGRDEVIPNVNLGSAYDRSKKIIEHANNAESDYYFDPSDNNDVSSMAHMLDSGQVTDFLYSVIKVHLQFALGHYVNDDQASYQADSELTIPEQKMIIRAVAINQIHVSGGYPKGISKAKYLNDHINKLYEDDPDLAYKILDHNNAHHELVDANAAIESQQSSDRQERLAHERDVAVGDVIELAKEDGAGDAKVNSIKRKLYAILEPLNSVEGIHDAKRKYLHDNASRFTDMENKQFVSPEAIDNQLKEMIKWMDGEFKAMGNQLVRSHEVMSEVDNTGGIPSRDVARVNLHGTYDDILFDMMEDKSGSNLLEKSVLYNGTSAFSIFNMGSQNVHKEYRPYYNYIYDVDPNAFERMLDNRDEKSKNIYIDSFNEVDPNSLYLFKSFDDFVKNSEDGDSVHTALSPVTTELEGLRSTLPKAMNVYNAIIALEAIQERSDRGEKIQRSEFAKYSQIALHNISKGRGRAPAGHVARTQAAENMLDAKKYGINENSNDIFDQYMTPFHKRKMGQREDRGIISENSSLHRKRQSLGDMIDDII